MPRYLPLLLGFTRVALVGQAQPFQATEPLGPAGASPPVLNYAEQMPAFPGGEVALHRYLASHITYPPDAMRRGLSGQVVVQFVVDEQGRVLDPMVVKTTNAAFNDEARRLAWLMPRWAPGREHGQAVRVRCTLPITFTFKR
ncbi:energy transducer TonB [Hymenobacter cheonanensis]|uniref:energy transducer TonB n=1 Tax=Hymenobacter sp. CA2-7 TaxID=3063993 RepID=UPI0027140E18|nr:energy transducer TonB [Hymenobacter sp. CA2-7]MDO7884567.1 TonB family protein [Hymenobacter sp. CA2-7]